MLILALAGLPGVGKSHVARALAERLELPVFDKDRVRAALYGPRHVTYTRAQDDCVIELLEQAVRTLGDATGARGVLLDGRTYTRGADVLRLRAFTAEVGAELVLIECRCAPAVARERLRSDRERGAPAANRGPELHDRLARRAEPIDADVVLATDAADLERRLDLLARDLSARLDRQAGRPKNARPARFRDS